MQDDGGDFSGEAPRGELGLREEPRQSAALVVVPTHRQRAPRGLALSDQDGNALRVARAAAWASVEHAAAFLDVSPVTLRRMLERHARRGEDGVVVATVNGITAGHADLTTTERYAHTTAKNKHAAIAVLDEAA